MDQEKKSSYLRFAAMIADLDGGHVRADVSQHVRFCAYVFERDPRLHGVRNGRGHGGDHAELHARHVPENRQNIAIFLGGVVFAWRCGWCEASRQSRT